MDLYWTPLMTYVLIAALAVAAFALAALAVTEGPQVAARAGGAALGFMAPAAVMALIR